MVKISLTLEFKSPKHFQDTVKRARSKNMTVEQFIVGLLGEGECGLANARDDDGVLVKPVDVQ